LFDVSALLFATSAAVTIVCSTPTKAIADLLRVYHENDV
jgi:hypothetical protein